MLEPISLRKTDVSRRNGDHSYGSSGPAQVQSRQNHCSPVSTKGSPDWAIDTFVKWTTEHAHSSSKQSSMLNSLSAWRVWGGARNVIVIVISFITQSFTLIRIPYPFNSFVKQVRRGVLNFHVISSLQTRNYSMQQNNNKPSKELSLRRSRNTLSSCSERYQMYK